MGHVPLTLCLCVCVCVCSHSLFPRFLASFLVLLPSKKVFSPIENSSVVVVSSHSRSRWGCQKGKRY